MSRCRRKCKKIKLGYIVAAIGVGIVFAVIIPFWVWIMAVGAALIYFGWYLLEQHH